MSKIKTQKINPRPKQAISSARSHKPLVTKRIRTAHSSTSANTQKTKQLKAKLQKSPRNYASIKNKRFKKRLRAWLLPNADNQYRPLLIRRYGLMLLLAIIIAVQLVYNFSKTGSVLGRVTNISSSGLLASTNQRRAEHGLSPLQINTELSGAALSKAQDMISRNYWGHISPDGVEPWFWIENIGYDYQEAGENLAKNFSTAQATVSAWMDSEKHRDNILNPNYKDVGFAVATGEISGKNTTIVVALYATPATLAPVGLTDRSDTAKSASKDQHYVVFAPTDSYSLSLAAKLGIAIQSLTPAAITSIALLFIAITVALTAQFFKSKLPKSRQETWYKNHGAVKATGLLSMVAMILFLYGGGQI